MAFKQPRVPEYRENEGAAKHLRALTLFLKDFCQDVWTASRNADKATQKAQEGVDSIKYPVISVNKKTGDVVLGASDVGARAGNWMPNLENVAFLGVQPIQDPAKDTTAAWTSLGSGYAWYSEDGSLNGQPSRWGFILNYAKDSDVFQIWNEQDGGPTYIRSGNAGGWKNGWRKLFDNVNTPYPVGSIFMSTNSTSPASLFGGTWEQMKDRFLLGAGSTYSAGSTGGAATVTLATAQLPNVKGSVIAGAGNAGVSAGGYGVFRSAGGVFAVSGERQYTGNGWQGGWPSSAAAYERFTMSFGSGQSHNNMPPYLTVYMWRRVS